MILGDQNADPIDGDAILNPILMLLDSSTVDTSITPTSAGALEQVPGSFSERDTKTATFWFRADYALPSQSELDLEQAFVMWPLTTDLEAGINGASDHRMVVVVSGSRKGSACLMVRREGCEEKKPLNFQRSKWKSRRSRGGQTATRQTSGGIVLLELEKKAVYSSYTLAEETGIYFGKDPKTMFVNIQHSALDDNDATWAITKVGDDDEDEDENDD